MGNRFRMVSALAIVWSALTPNFASAIEPKQEVAVGKGTAVAYPWAFQGGDKTSKMTAVRTAREIASRSGYTVIPGDVASATWRKGGWNRPMIGQAPSHASLEAFGKALHAKEVIFGSVAWHTRSIWVFAGPKTISTATVSVYVFDVAANKVVFRAKGTEGRSDEKANGWKLAADVIITPLVSVVSGGPATPQEERAVQIALGKACHPWVWGNLGRS